MLHFFSAKGLFENFQGKFGKKNNHKLYLPIFLRRAQHIFGKKNIINSIYFFFIEKHTTLFQYRYNKLLMRIKQIKQRSDLKA